MKLLTSILALAPAATSIMAAAASQTSSSPYPPALSFRFDHVGLSVANLTAQAAFYRTILGFSTVNQHLHINDPVQAETIQLASPNGVVIELVQRAGSVPNGIAFDDPISAAKGQGYFHWCLSVEDLDTTFAKLVDAGVRVVSEPTQSAPTKEDHGTRFAYIADPEGNLIELVEHIE